ncbi:MAG: 3-deoxy-manno-octulosonate cytidylyltransferase [Desulfobacteraceae bacterium]|nr:3-deoxy-manno-octulosonate cytidylyltransferase [Desulfobacteraceae bacterium]
MSIAVIPSRFGSSRFEGKPLALIAGKPMIQRVYEQASKARNITKVVVATDDQRIFDTVTGFGGQAVMTASELKSGTDRVAKTAEILGLGQDDIIVNVQGDQPLFDPACLDELLAPFAGDPDLGMSTLAYRITNPRELTDPTDVKVCFDRNGFALYFSRSRIPFPRDGETGVATYKHLGFYAYKKSFLDTIAALPVSELENIEKLEQLRVLEYGHRIKVVVTEHDSPEVDLPEDIARLEQHLNNQS